MFSQLFIQLFVFSYKDTQPFDAFVFFQSSPLEDFHTSFLDERRHASTEDDILGRQAQSDDILG